jgi:phage baseplate assembly protein W
MAIGISPALPLDYNQLDGPYRLTKTIKEAITQNFKNLILTNPGEKMMDPDFGVGIRQFLFELDNGGVQQEVRERIYQQTGKYLSSVQILDVRFSGGSNDEADQITMADSNAMYIQILFKILAIDSVNVLTLPLFT